MIQLKNSKFIGYIVIIILIILLAGQCKINTNLKRESIKSEQNLLAADSIISEYKNKDGSYQAEKAIYILSKKELKKQNKDLYDKVDNQKGRIVSLNNAIISLKQDISILHDSINFLHSIIGEAEQISATKWKLPWILQYKWDDLNYDIFKGHTIVEVDTNNHKVKHANTIMDERESQIDLTFGEKVVDGKYNVYVTSKYPGLNTSSMQGVLIDPNTNKDIKKLIDKKHWFAGFSVSIGISPGYDMINKKPTMVIGPTLGYTIFQW